MAIMLDELRAIAPAASGRFDGGHSAVLLDTRAPMLEILEGVLDDIDVATLAKHSRPCEALEAIRTQRPDVFIVELPGGEGDLAGLESIRQARALVPTIKPIVLADTSDATTVGAAFEAGAVAAVSLAGERDDVMLAVRQALEPSIYLAHALLTGPARAQVDTGGPGGELTRREREILRLVAEGYPNSRVARLLWVTEKTVKFHLSNIYRKLAVTNRTEASRWAQRNGLLLETSADRGA
jgi:DNA-binding NarL/FixJ family response regulator